MPISSFRDIALELSDRYDEREIKLPKIRGEIVQVRQSDGQDSIWVEGRPGYVWVRVFDMDGNVMPLLCRLTNPINGMPVTISRMPGSPTLEIISFDDEVARADADYDGHPYLRAHHLEHEWPDGAPGADAVTVYPRAMSQLRTYPENPASLIVNVSPLRYLYQGASTVFGGNTIDLTASVPAAGQARLVLVYLDPSTNTLSSTNGAVGPIGAAWTLPEPAHTNNMIDSAVVRLENGQTTIIESDIRDRRALLNSDGFQHNVFSATHPDAITDVVAKGDIPVGNATPQLEPLTVGGTAGYRLVVDAAQGQGMRWGLDFLWPWNDRIQLRDANAANTEYTTIAAAIAVAQTGDTIIVPPGTWTCNAETLPDGVNLVGLDRDLTILQTTTSATVLALGNGSYVYGVTLKNEWSSVVYIAGVQPPNAPGTATLHNCKIIVNNTRAAGVDPAYGMIGDASHDGTLTLIETDIETSTGGAAGWSLGVYANIFNVIVRGGRIDSGTVGASVYDLYSLNGYEIDVDGAILANHTIGGTGLVKGVLHDHLLDNLIDTAHIGDLLGDAELLLSTDFQRFEQLGTGANRANYIIGSKLEQLRLGAAGENADDRGTVHYEAGRWRGKRALVIEHGETNDCTNPLMRDDDADNVADNFVTFDSVAGAVTWSVIDHPDKLRKGWAQRIQYTGIGGDVAAAIQLRFSTAAASYAPADDCTQSCEVWGTHSGVTVYLWMRAETAANVLIAQTSVDITADITNAPKRFSLTYENLPALTDHVRCDLRIQAIDNGDVVDLKVAACNIEDNNYGTTLIQGGYGEGYAWAGVPHTSLPTRNNTYLFLDDHVGLVTDNNTMTFRCVVRAPYDYDEDWPGTGGYNYLFDLRGADNNNRIILAYDFGANDRFTVYLNGAWRILCTSVAFSAGDWLELVLTSDFASNHHELSLNGERIGYDSTALTAPTGVTDWVVGDNYTHSGNYVGGFWWAEYSVLDRALIQWEIGNLHLANRPITDFFDNANSFTMPGTAAGVWPITGPRHLTTSATYVEVNDTTTGDSRITFAGLWVRALVFFEVSLQNNNGAVTTYAQLQYYDEATAAWRAVPETELSVTGVTANRVRTTVPLHLPLQEVEYRVMQHSDGVNNSMSFKGKILVQPGGEDNL